MAEIDGPSSFLEPSGVTLTLTDCGFLHGIATGDGGLLVPESVQRFSRCFLQSLNDILLPSASEGCSLQFGCN